MHELNNLLRKLIRSGAGRKRFLMASAGLSVAMVLILAAVQIQANYQQLLYGENNQDSIANFLVVNKKLTNKNIGAASLNAGEIEKLKQQPFVDAAGVLTASRFKASIQSRSERFPFYTDIAFESVPKDFLDVNSEEWHWEEGQVFVPIIVPNMFLDFYNFQFAASQDLPQLTQEVVKMIGFTVNLYDASGRTFGFTGRVVGFSDRISSLLVPEAFMQWANNRFATQQVSTDASRVIIRTKDPGNPELVTYLQSHGLTTDADKTRFSKYRKVVNIVVNIAWLTGAILFLFAMLIFTLFIQLTIANSREDIKLLVTLGASPSQLRGFLFKQFFPPNIWIVLVALMTISVLQYLLAGWLHDQQMFLSAWPSHYLLLTAVIVLVVIGLVNRVTISNYVARP